MRQQQLLMAWLLFLLNLTLYTLLFQNYLMGFFSHVLILMELIYLVFLQISLKITDSKKLIQTTDSSDTSGLCNLPSLLLALWPTFSFFMVLIHIYLVRSYRGVRHHVSLTPLQRCKTSPALCYCASSLSLSCVLVPTPPGQIQDT